jgi:uncharacterized paraquat-inducible protein A
MFDARQAAFSAFIRTLAEAQARQLARCPSYLTDVECPRCGAYFGIRNTGLDQRADCPECGARYDVGYDAEWTSERGWRGGHTLVRGTP